MVPRLSHYILNNLLVHKKWRDLECDAGKSMKKISSTDRVRNEELNNQNPPSCVNSCPLSSHYFHTQSFYLFIIVDIAGEPYLTILLHTQAFNP